MREPIPEMSATALLSGYGARPSNLASNVDGREDALIVTHVAEGAYFSDNLASHLPAIRIPIVIADPERANDPIVFLKDAFVTVTGRSRGEIIGQNCPFLQSPSTNVADIGKSGEPVAPRVAIELDLCNRRADGEILQNRLHLSPLFGEGGALTYFFASHPAVTPEIERLARLQGDRDSLAAEAQQRAFDLAVSEERLRFTQKAGRIGSWTLDLSDMRLMASDGCKDNFGRSPDDPFTYEAWIEAIHTDDRGRMKAAIAASIAGRTNYDIEYRITTPLREVRWIQSRGHASYRLDGTPLIIAGISLDITDRKLVEQHRDLLAKELSHRVKNTLAIVQSIARQTLRRSTSLQEAEIALDARIQSLAAAHDVLTRDSWEGATLTEVVAVALRPFGIEQKGRFEFSGPALRLSSRVALAFAMALHELATNAAKYGALSNEAGHILLRWGVVDGWKPDRLRFQWQEMDGPSVRPPTRTGFGSRMIERALASEIGGTAAIDFQPGGVVFTAEAPLPEVLKD